MSHYFNELIYIQVIIHGIIYEVRDKIFNKIRQYDAFMLSKRPTYKILIELKLTFYLEKILYLRIQLLLIFDH